MERKSEVGHQREFVYREPRTRRSYAPPLIPDVFLRPDVDERKARLAEVLSGQIVPRLQLLHHDVRRVAPTQVPGPEEIAEFGALAMATDADGAMAYFERMRSKGNSLETLFVHFLAPTATYLGDLWEQDRCDFIDVTLGVARLQELLDMFGSSGPRHIIDMRHSSLLATVPGERHLFGVDMVATFMRGAGWDVTVETGLHPDEIANFVAKEWVGVFGMTLSAETGLDALARAIEGVRRASANRSISVMVGGPAFVKTPELVAQVGADAAAGDAPTAVILAKKLLMLQTGSD
jgi:methanogenic corrinoid protein MtbC1